VDDDSIFELTAEDIVGSNTNTNTDGNTDTEIDKTAPHKLIG
jgi:hypothetical protein